VLQTQKMTRKKIKRGLNLQLWECLSLSYFFRTVLSQWLKQINQQKLKKQT